MWSVIKFHKSVSRTLSNMAIAPILHTNAFERTLKRHGSSTDKCCKYCAHMDGVRDDAVQRNKKNTCSDDSIRFTANSCISSTPHHVYTIMYIKCQITQVPSGILRNGSLFFNVFIFLKHFGSLCTTVIMLKVLLWSCNLRI